MDRTHQPFTDPPAEPPPTRRSAALRLLLDSFLAVSFPVLMSVPFTGLPLHEWWGIAVIAAVLAHLVLQWDWTISTTRNFLRALSGRLRFTYLLNWALFICAVLLLFSGLAISEVALPQLHLPTTRGQPLFIFWRRLHTATANGCLILAGVHLGLNWRWVVATTGRLWSRLRHPRPGPAAEVNA